MGWEYSSDVDGEWSIALKTALGAPSTPALLSSSPAQGSSIAIAHGSIVKRISIAPHEDFESSVLERVRAVIAAAVVNEDDAVEQAKAVQQLFWVDDEGDVCVVGVKEEFSEFVRLSADAGWPMILFTTASQARSSAV